MEDPQPYAELLARLVFEDREEEEPEQEPQWHGADCDCAMRGR
ncbi:MULTISPECIES: hypothetical protein [Hydrocarboniphaga]|jgi:hypothetical protein|uniref:Uncharacterized protein n=1 Tax=Hydrocarboniphaga effusa AP103 TaxID=1172194 RepID=I7ZJI1_9GAMM|nr:MULTISPECIES: hypothetical protein [Hydrocarboniphaga]EIT71922.1 hypothetical protein WQQ_20590 [Hydrocarboniphaga effusa AP103]MDZ4077374.1 hypothetical protein [Hydrocarboniphaga sp.]